MADLSNFRFGHSSRSDLLDFNLKGKIDLKKRQIGGFSLSKKGIWKHFYAILLLASSAAQLLASDEGDVRRLSQVQLFLKKRHFIGFSTLFFTQK